MNYSGLENYILDRLTNELSPNLRYHGVNHTLSVIDVAMIISETESLTDDELIIVKTSALLHDFGFIYNYNENEQLASDFAKEILHNYSYNEIEINTICKLILSTRMPQQPETKLQKILCDADLGNLGMDNYKDISSNLRKELELHNNHFSNVDWMEFQLNFITNHRYFSETAQRIFNKRKEENRRVLECEFLNSKSK